MSNPLRAVLYCRVSSDRQREQGTIESQRDALLTYARAMGWTILSVEQDDGISGEVAPWERPGMARVLGLVRQKAMDVVLVYAVDRIARDENNVDFALVRRELIKAGVQLATPKGFLDFNSPEQRLHQDILSALASYERHQIKDRTVRGRRAAILKGGRPIADVPLGYCWNDESRSLDVVEEEAAVVREIFRLMAEENLGLFATARRLKRMGVTSRRAKFGVDKNVTPGLVSIVVQRELYYTGQWEAHPDWLPGHLVPAVPVVSEEVWRRANRVRELNHRRQETKHKQDYLLRGIARCALCGSSMRVHTKALPTHVIQYYRCTKTLSTYQFNHEPCTSGTLRADMVDEAVWNHLTSLLTTPGLLRAEMERVLAEEQKDQPSAEEGIRELDRKLAELDEAKARGLRAMTRGLVTEDEFAELATDLERQRMPLRQRRELLSLAARSESDRRNRLQAIEAQVAELRPRLDALSYDERRALVQDLVEEVRVDTKTRTVQVVTVLGIVEPEAAPSGEMEPGASGGQKRRPRLAAARVTRTAPKRRGIGKNEGLDTRDGCRNVEAP